MCGIFGITIKYNPRLSPEDIHKAVEQFLCLSEMRGKESSGIAIKNNALKKIGVVRKSCPGKQFIHSKEFIDVMNQFVGRDNMSKGLTLLGHTRIATNGYVSFDNQPISKNGSFGIHNGIICNIEELWDQHNELIRKQVIDSELLFGLIKDRLD